MPEQDSRSATKKLTAGQKQLASVLYGEYGDEVVQEVRKLLRKVSKSRTGASVSAVAQSVWASFMESHVGEVDLTDEESAWRLLLAGANRHCEKWNKRAYRHPQVSLDTVSPNPGGAAALCEGYQPESTREAPPEVAVMVAECASLFASLDDSSRPHVGEAVSRVEQGMGLVERLTFHEREVLGLKLAGRSRPEIAQQLGKDETRVDDLWKSVKEKARTVSLLEGGTAHGIA